MDKCNILFPFSGVLFQIKLNTWTHSKKVKVIDENLFHQLLKINTNDLLYTKYKYRNNLSIK